MANGANSGAGGVESVNVGPITIDGCLIWGNGGPQVLGRGTTTITVTHSNIQGGQFGGDPTNISADPLFAGFFTGDYHLSTVSPCVDAGNPSPPSPLPSTDLDGTARVVNGLPDMGADELPAALLPGSGEDFDLYAVINGAGDPLASAIPAAAFDLLTVQLRSPGGSFAGAPPVLVGQLFVNGAPPCPNVPGFPELHINGGPGTVLMFGDPGADPFAAPGLPPEGVTLHYQIPPFLVGVGLSLRMQAFITSLLAGNGVFATSDARDVLM